MEKSLPKDVEIAALLPAYTQEGDVTHDGSLSYCQRYQEYNHLAR